MPSSVKLRSPTQQVANPMYPSLNNSGSRLKCVLAPPATVLDNPVQLASWRIQGRNYQDLVPRLRFSDIVRSGVSR